MVMFVWYSLPKPIPFCSFLYFGIYVKKSVTMAEKDSDGGGDDLEYLLQTPKAGTAREVPPMRKARHECEPLDGSSVSLDNRQGSQLLFCKQHVW